MYAHIFHSHFADYNGSQWITSAKCVNSINFVLLHNIITKVYMCRYVCECRAACIKQLLEFFERFREHKANKTAETHACWQITRNTFSIACSLLKKLLENT